MRVIITNPENVHSEPNFAEDGGKKFFHCSKAEEQFYRQAFIRHGIDISQSSDTNFGNGGEVKDIHFELLSGSETDHSIAFDDATKTSRPYPRKRLDAEKG